MRWSFPVPLVIAAVLAGAGPAAADVSSVVRFTGPSPFVPGCGGPPAGELFRNAEVESLVARHPTHAGTLVAVWQQDRWSTGGAEGVLTARSTDGGRTWQRPAAPKFTRCAAGTAANGGNYERATNPWVTFGPTGTAFQSTLGFNVSDPTAAVLVARSTTGGATWGSVTTIHRDTSPQFFNDRPTITADRYDSRYVYAVWTRLEIQDPSDPESPVTGKTMFARSVDGGKTWGASRAILSPPPGSNQGAIGPQIVVLGDGTLANVYTFLSETGPVAAVQRSRDKGATWSAPTVIDQVLSSAIVGPGVVDPSDGTPVRTQDFIPEVAADPRAGKRTLHVLWQDTRFGASDAPRDQIVLVSSFDGGVTWRSPRRVSENASVQAFTGSIDVASDGTIGLTYHDFTYDEPSGGPLATDVWFATSGNGGDSFTRRQRVTRSSFDLRTAPDSDGLFLGERAGLTATGSGFATLPILTTGDPANRSDGFAAQATASGPYSKHAATLTAPSAATLHPAARRLWDGARR